MPITSNPKDATLAGRVQWYDGSVWHDTTFNQIKSLLGVEEANSDRPEYVTQYSSPANGATVQVADGSIFLLLTPVNILSTLTIKLPAFANLEDKQELLVFSTNGVTSVTYDENGAANIRNPPSSLSADGRFTLRYDAQTQTWYRIG